MAKVNKAVAAVPFHGFNAVAELKRERATATATARQPFHGFNAVAELKRYPVRHSKT